MTAAEEFPPMILPRLKIRSVWNTITVFGPCRTHQIQGERGTKMIELWDLYDADRRPLHKTHVRGVPMTPGEYHTVVGVWTVNRQEEILLTLRHPQKESYPNMWENTEGSVVAGETSKAGAARELREETGIAVEESELILLGSRKEKRAFIDTYLTFQDVPVENLTMQEGETVQAKWVTMEELDEMIQAGLLAAPVVERFASVRAEFEKLLLQRRDSPHE